MNLKNPFLFGAVIFLILGIAIQLSSCFEMQNAYTKVAPGTWRAVLLLDNKAPAKTTEDLKPFENFDLQFDEVTEGELPFTMEVIYEDETNFYIEIINGEERIPVRDIQFGRTLERAMDTILIDFPLYETYIKAWVEGNVMEGAYYVPTRGDYKIPFVATHGKAHRFSSLEKQPALDLTGKWEATFGLAENDPYPAIGEFEQKGNYLTGTFRTETGDYRFLEGTVQANKIYLSCFDGSHAFLFEAKIREDSTLIGSFRSGKHYQSIWEAKRNPDVELASPDSLTYLKEGYESVSFAFDNPDGKSISLDDPMYQDKPKIIQILGTWCPNCRDETTFLVNYLKENPNLEIEVIALAFEKYKEKARADEAIRKYKKHFGMNYEMVYAGYYNKKEAAKSLPMLNHILSYPTMIFLDKNNQVRRIHTGFEGPATSRYASFVKDFDEFVTALAAE